MYIHTDTQTHTHVHTIAHTHTWSHTHTHLHMRTTQPQGGGSSNSSGKGGSAGAANHGGGAAAGVVLAGVAVLRAAAMRTLLASVLAPCPGQRPPYLAQALLLFSVHNKSCSGVWCKDKNGCLSHASLQLSKSLFVRIIPNPFSFLSCQGIQGSGGLSKVMHHAPFFSESWQVPRIL